MLSEVGIVVIFREAWVDFNLEEEAKKVMSRGWQCCVSYSVLWLLEYINFLIINQCNEHCWCPTQIVYPLLSCCVCLVGCSK